MVSISIEGSRLVLGRSHHIEWQESSPLQR